MRTTYELTASGKEFSFPFAADARLVTNKYDFMRVLHSVEGLCPKNPCCTPLLCLNSLFLFFSPAAFYAQGPRMDRQRVPSIFSSANSSFWDCFYSFQSVGVRFGALLFNLNFRVPYFSYSKGRKQSTKHRHCSTQEICKFGFFVPTKNQCEKAGSQPTHKFISRSKFHFFLRVLGRDFFRDIQILPSTAETSARRPIVKNNHDGFNLLQNSCYRIFYCRSFCLRLAKRASSNYKSFLGTTSFFKRQALFISRFVWVNYRFDSSSLSSGVRRGISFSVLRFFLLNQLPAYRKSKPSTAGRNSCSESCNDIAKMSYFVRVALLNVQERISQGYYGNNNVKDFERTFNRGLNQFANYLRFHSFLLVLGWDFLLDFQILPSTAETSARRIG